MARSRSSTDDSAEDLNAAEAEAIDMGQDPEAAVAAQAADDAAAVAAEQAADAQDAADAPAPEPAPVPAWRQFLEDMPAEGKKVVDAIKEWVRAELEHAAQGHSVESRKELNP